MNTIPIRPRTITFARRPRAGGGRWSPLACCLCILLIACGDEATAPADAPAGHTVIEDGVPHRPGLENPTENCVTCHGADLRGGAAGQPSCYSCHGKKWT